MNLALDASSAWTMTADSYLTCLTNPEEISVTTITNIPGNGYAVYTKRMPNFHLNSDTAGFGTNTPTQSALAISACV